MASDAVKLERDGAIARIILNRPEAGNSLDMAMARGLLDAASQCDADSSVRCVVLTGAGRMFCVGGDIGVFAAAGEATQALLSELAGVFHRAMSLLARMRKPLLTLVNGPAAGAGLSLAICGDVVLAGRASHFTAAYTAIGVSPDGGLTWALPRLIGLRKAQEMILANRRVGAEEAERIGLITRVVDDASLEEEGAALASLWARSATSASGAARALLLDSFGAEPEGQMEREGRSLAALCAGPDGREGFAAFVAKRKPLFNGA